MNRAERRAAQRLAMKSARPSEETISAETTAEPTQPPFAAESQPPAQEAPQPSTPLSSISPARLAANLLNAQSSTGPTTPEGKAKVSQNAVKHNLSGRSLHLPPDEAAQYESMLAAYQTLYQPVGPIETFHVQAIADSTWRLQSIPTLEYALLELGRKELAEANPEETRKMDSATLELRVRKLNEKSFRNYQLLEGRLFRRREVEMKQLAALQAVRKARELAELNRAAQAALLAKQQNVPFDPAALGFVFSTDQINAHLATLSPEARTNLVKECQGTVERSAAA